MRSLEIILRNFSNRYSKNEQHVIFSDNINKDTVDKEKNISSPPQERLFSGNSYAYKERNV